MSKIIDISINGMDFKMKRPAKNAAPKFIQEFVETSGYHWKDASKCLATPACARSDKMTDSVAANGIKHLIDVLRIISSKSVSRVELEAITGLSRASLARLLRVARQICSVEIIFVRNPGVAGGGGYYKINNYGVFSAKKMRGI